MPTTHFKSKTSHTKTFIFDSALTGMIFQGSQFVWQYYDEQGRIMNSGLIESERCNV